MANTINLNDIPANRWQDTRYTLTTAASFCKMYGDGGDITVSDCITLHVEDSIGGADGTEWLLNGSLINEYTLCKG